MTSPLKSIIMELLNPPKAATTDTDTQKAHVPPVVQVGPQPNPYFSDTISKTGEPFPTMKSTGILPQKKIQETNPPVNLYYVDTISKATPVNHTTAIPVKAAAQTSTTTAAASATAATAQTVSSVSPKPSILSPTQPQSRIEAYYEQLSFQVDTELQNDNKNFEKLRSTIDKVLMLLFRLAAVADQERIFEINVTVKTQAYTIKGTYNKWDGVSITVLSSGVSFAASFASFSPFLPASMIAAETAKVLSGAAMQLGTMSTSMSGLGSLFSSREEGNRTVYQIYLKKYQDQEEEKRGSKHAKNDLIKSAKASSDEFERNRHDSMRAMTG